MTAALALAGDVVTDAERLAALMPDAFTRSPNVILLQRVRGLRLTVQATLLEHANGPMVYAADGLHRARIQALTDLRLVQLRRDGKTSELTALGSSVVCAMLARMADTLTRQRRAQ